MHWKHCRELSIFKRELVICSVQHPEHLASDNIKITHVFTIVIESKFHGEKTKHNIVCIFDSELAILQKVFHSVKYKMRFVYVFCLNNLYSWYDRITYLNHVLRRNEESLFFLNKLSFFFENGVETVKIQKFVDTLLYLSNLVDSPAKFIIFLDLLTSNIVRKPKMCADI